MANAANGIIRVAYSRLCLFVVPEMIQKSVDVDTSVVVFVDLLSFRSQSNHAIPYDYDDLFEFASSVILP